MALPKMYHDLFIGQVYNGYFGELGDSPVWCVFYRLKKLPPGVPDDWFCWRVCKPGEPHEGTNDAMLVEDALHVTLRDNLRDVVVVRVDHVSIMQDESVKIVSWGVEDITRYDTDSLSNIMPVIRGERESLDKAVRAAIIDFLNTELQPDETGIPEHQHDIGGSD